MDLESSLTVMCFVKGKGASSNFQSFSFSPFVGSLCTNSYVLMPFTWFYNLLSLVILIISYVCKSMPIKIPSVFLVFPELQASFQCLSIFQTVFNLIEEDYFFSLRDFQHPLFLSSLICVFWLRSAAQVFKSLEKRLLCSSDYFSKEIQYWSLKSLYNFALFGVKGIKKSHSIWPQPRLNH